MQHSRSLSLERSLTSFQPRGLPQMQPQRKTKSTSISTLCKMLKVAIGSGVLAMPSGFAQVHVLGGIITICYTLMLQFYSWLVLTQAIEEKTKIIQEKRDNYRRKMSTRGLPEFQIERRIQEKFNEDSNYSSSESEGESKRKAIQVDKNMSKSIELTQVYPKNQGSSSSDQSDQGMDTSPNKDALHLKNPEISLDVSQELQLNDLSLQQTNRNQSEEFIGEQEQQSDMDQEKQEDESQENQENQENQDTYQQDRTEIEQQDQQNGSEVEKYESQTDKSLDSPVHQRADVKPREGIKMRSALSVTSRDNVDPNLPKKQRIIEDYRNYKDAKTIQKEIMLAMKLNEKERKRKIEERRRLERRIEYLDFSIYDFMRKEFQKNKWVILMLQIATLILLWGCNISYITFWNTTFQNIFGVTVDPGIKMAIIFALFLSVMVFSFQSRLENLRGFVFIGSYLQLIILYFILSLCLYQLKLNNQEDKQENKEFYQSYPDEIEIQYGINPLQLPTFFGTALFAFDINGVITEIRQEMRKTYRFTRVLFLSMVIEAVIYILIGSVGYMAYGQYTSDIITTNVAVTINAIGPGIYVVFLLLQVLYAFSLMITVLLDDVVAFKILDEMLEISKLGQRQKIFYQLMIRVTFIFSFVVIGVYFENFSVIVSLVGCISTIMLGFVLPYCVFYKLFYDKASDWILGFNTFILVIGVLGGFAGVIIIFFN